MPRKARPQKTVRLNLALAPVTRKAIERLRADMSAGSMEEVVRRSIALCDEVLKIKSRNGRLFTKIDGEEYVEIVIIV